MKFYELLRVSIPWELDTKLLVHYRNNEVEEIKISEMGTKKLSANVIGFDNNEVWLI